MAWNKTAEEDALRSRSRSSPLAGASALILSIGLVCDRIPTRFI
jgi:hypothetical protein